MSAIILEAPGSMALSKGWIISKRDDLIWFIGSSLLGYVALAATIAGAPVVPILVVWSLLFDGPHVFATASRTYLDRQARACLGWRLWMLLPLLLVGPAMWLAGAGNVFWVLFITWAQYHIAKQHMGFVMLYRTKAGERQDVAMDKQFALVSLMLPWALFLYALARWPMFKYLAFVTATVYMVVAVAYFRTQIQKLTRGESCPQKLLLLATVVPLQWLSFFYASFYADSSPEAFAVAAIATNLGHSLQYQRLTWFHNQNRYKHETIKSVGFASVINSRVTIYLGTAIILNFLLYGLPHIALHGSETWLAMLTGMNMMHYYLDSKIWRVRSDKQLAHALRLAP